MKMLTLLAGAMGAGVCLAQGTGSAPDSEVSHAERPAWDAAVGLITHHSPNYLGAADSRWHLTPGVFVRYGRFSITTSSGFVTRRNDEVERGVAAELVSRDDFRVSLSARTDGGRDAGDDPALSGLPDVRPTVRARLSAVKKFEGGWRLGLGWSPDLLGRGGGATLDLSVSHERRVGPGRWMTAGISSTWADARYMQSYFGITPAQSSASGHPSYQPGAGLRDLSLGIGWRAELGPHWLGFVGAGLTRLAGPTLDSPLTRRRDVGGLNGGLAWRF